MECINCWLGVVGRIAVYFSTRTETQKCFYFKLLLIKREIKCNWKYRDSALFTIDIEKDRELVTHGPRFATVLK